MPSRHFLHPKFASHNHVVFTFSVQKQSVFLGTPKAVDPMNVLKKNLRQKVDKNLDDKVAGLPENSSPYAMLSGETENGTPVERFVKIQKPTAEIAAKFVTGTPGIFCALPHILNVCTAYYRFLDLIQAFVSKSFRSEMTFLYTLMNLLSSLAPSLAQPPRSTRRGTASKRHLAISQVWPINLFFSLSLLFGL